MRVLIIGAGLGGLTLLHGLRRAGIAAHVYERAADATVQPASYGIHLNADGLAALHACLPPANWDLVTAAGTPAPNVIRFQDPSGTTLAAIDKRSTAHHLDPITKRRAISRGKLLAALLLGTDPQPPNGATAPAASHGSDPLVTWGRRFTHYELVSDGQVRAHFEDGSHADGDLLVGADGASSRVRHQLLPDLDRKDLGIVNIAGRVPLTPKLEQALPAEMTDGSINNIVPAGRGWLFLSTWAVGDPNSSDVSSGADQYIVWAWAAARDSYPTHVEQVDPSTLKQFVQERVQDWATPIQTLIAETDPQTIAPVTLRTMPTLPIWPTSRVTLLGDAIHNMTPMAGIGANTALRDADQLRRALTSITDKPDTGTAAVEAVSQYETVMRSYANDGLALSTRNARNAALASPLNRATFRMLLRAAEAIPPFKRKIFDTPSPRDNPASLLQAARTNNTP